MSVLDDVLLNVKSAAEAAGRAAGHFADVSKLRVAAAELRSELDKQYKKLGQAVYASSRSGADCPELIEDYVQAIDELTEQLKSVTQELEAMDSRPKCPACGMAVQKDDIFCSRCGAKLRG